MLDKLFNNSDIIDCRTDDEYSLSRASQSAHISADHLFNRMHELPQRGQAFIVICNISCIAQCKDFFEEKKYQAVTLLQWNKSIIQALKSVDRFDSNTLSHQQKKGVPIALWQPAQLIKDFTGKHCQNFAIIPGKGLDIGCGSGRDLVYLAKQGWHMHGLDYNLGSIRRCEDLALRHHCHVECKQTDLEETVFSGAERQNALYNLANIEPQSLDLITVFRYLHRPLFAAIRHSLKPGGVVLYQTFMQGCEVISRPKNPRFLLAESELANEFSSELGFEILLDQTELLGDGRPVSSFLARKL